MDDLFHHLIHFLTYSLVLWQLILGIWILLKWVSKNFKFHRSPVLNIGESFKGGSPIEETLENHFKEVILQVKKQR